MKLALIAVVVVAVAVKLFQRRLPRVAYQAVVAVVLLLPIAATGYAIWSLWNEWIGWRELALFLGLWIATGFGISIGYHRLLTHRSFETGQVVKGVFLALGAMANQGRCIDWAAHHLKHHAHSDREGDPHSPLQGFFHAHTGWILSGPPAERERYCKRLLDDRLVRFMDTTQPLWVVLGLVIPYAAAGWRGLLWGGFVRLVVLTHATFTVNSICHMFGTRPFDTNDESRNNPVIGILALGEGWHNNHHAFPSMAFHGMTRWQIDISGYLIRLLDRLGLVWNVKLPSTHAIKRRRSAVPA
ncbi:MAG TPA: acyl-CoA desaturase [Gaiellaceae bacterium]|nr:acyl-CoA desaturase [Gaiellaceae bacterium]